MDSNTMAVLMVLATALMVGIMDYHHLQNRKLDILEKALDLDDDEEEEEEEEETEEACVNCRLCKGREGDEE